MLLPLPVYVGAVFPRTMHITPVLFLLFEVSFAHDCQQPVAPSPIVTFVEFEWFIEVKPVLATGVSFIHVPEKLLPIHVKLSSTSSVQTTESFIQSLFFTLVVFELLPV